MPKLKEGYSYTCILSLHLHGILQGEPYHYTVKLFIRSPSKRILQNLKSGQLYMITRLWVGLRNLGSIPGRDSRFFCLHPYHVWDPPNLLFSGYWELSPK
jgi:hypothetical protein